MILTLQRHNNTGAYRFDLLSNALLPDTLSDGMGFFKSAVEEKVICVPGEFFDVNPGKRRSGRPSRFRSYARFSFEPEKDRLEKGIRRILKLVKS